MQKMTQNSTTQTIKSKSKMIPNTKPNKLSQAIFSCGVVSVSAVFGLTSSLTHAQENNTVITLPTTKVQASHTNNNGYTSSQTTSSTGLALAPKKLPQSISVITAEQIAEQNIQSMDYAVAQATGVSNQVYGSNGAGYNYFFARGNKINNFQLDGVPTNDVMADLGNLSASAYDRIEVVRGVSGLLDGSGETSATVNLIRKKPTTDAHRLVSLSAGSRKNFGLQADASGSLNTDKSLRGRAVISATDGDTWRQREHRQTASVYGVLDYDVTEQTTLTAGVNYQQTKEDNSASHSTATYDSSGYATKLGTDHNPAPDWAYSDTNTINTFVGIEHNFNDAWQANLEYNFTQHQLDHPYGVAGVLGVDHKTGAADMIPGFWKGKPKTHSLSAKVTGEYQLFDRQHELTAGINGFDYKSDRHGARSFAGIKNIYNQNEIAGFVKPDASKYKAIRTDAEKRQYGGYIATNLHPVDGLSILLGGRYSDFDYKSYGRALKKMVGVDGAEFTPYTGIVFDVSDAISTYASYTQLFSPQSQKNVNGAYIDPIKGSNVEVGIKGAWHDDKLNASLSVFQSKKDNLAVEAGKHADGEKYYKATDHSKTQGWELDLAGAMTDYWQIQAGYTQALNQDSKGNRLNTESSPRHILKLFSTYDFKQGKQHGLKMGAGVRWQSETHSGNVFGKFDADAKARALDNAKQQAYAVVDAMASYRINKHHNIQLNVDNLFNEEYRTQPDRHSYGKERTIMGTWQYKF